MIRREAFTAESRGSIHTRDPCDGIRAQCGTEQQAAERWQHVYAPFRSVRTSDANSSGFKP